MRTFRSALAIMLAIMTMTTSFSASAQFFPDPRPNSFDRPGQPYIPPQPRVREAPRPVPVQREYYDDRRDRRGGDWDRRGGRDWDDRRGGRDWDDRRGSRRASNGICVTSRGTCRADPRLAPGTNCRCEIPGFGTKRGNIQ